MKRQQGMSLGGLILLLGVLIFAVYIVARVFPAYMDYWQVQHIMENTLTPIGSEKLTAQEIRSRFRKELDLNNIKTITASDLLIEPTQDGYKLTAEYSVKAPFWREISLVMDFKAVRESQ